MARPSVVLGIVDGLHDAGAALVADGRIIAAANEERFTRVKLQGGMPRQSVEAVLATAGMGYEDIDAIAVGGKATPTLATRVVRPLQRLYGPSLGICFDRPWHPVDRLGDLVRYRLSLTRGRSDRGLGKAEGRLAKPVVRRGLPSPLRELPLHFVDHHLAHAESAWRTSGDGRWLVVTADAHGDGRSLTVHVAEPGQPLRLIHEIGVKQSVGAFYSYVTKRLGFRPGRHEGKVLGLSARGDPAAIPMRFPFHWTDGHLQYDGAWGLKAMKALRVLEGHRREDVAAWVQAGTVSVLVPAIQAWLREQDTTRLALAGGVFANVCVNGELAALPEIERLHVFPHMGDGGLAAGAALHVHDAPAQPLGTALLGPEPTDAELDAAAQGAGLPCERSEDPDGALVDAVAAGQPAVRYEGPMEFGPRALGHRSVLAPVDDPGITDPLNEALRREEFMPFAPLLRHEDGAGAFEHYGVAEAATRYMTVALPATPDFAERCPAAVHVDGTARPQTVRADEDLALHALVGRLAERTGRPAVINTSFNLHEEPIVNTPDEAVRAFVQSGLPVMRMGPYVLRNPGSRWRAQAD
ncbi:MAG: carbamoyltransferase C-terminal domain-containing protein [Planctomycetota bacterium]|nr:carbamoyltransferase C-terminal domain-containing protein [Planctomycetota bacterium]